MATKLSETRSGRLSDLAAQSRDAQHTAAVARRRLQDEVLEAIDVDHISPVVVARAIGVSSTRIYAIIVAGSRRQ